MTCPHGKLDGCAVCEEVARLERDLAAAIERAERAEAALQRIALLDPSDTDEGYNEWGEAACYVEAKDIADAALAAKETKE